jgi:hypothetical protein
VIVLNRQVKRPQLTAGDRLRFVFLAGHYRSKNETRLRRKNKYRNV